LICRGAHDNRPVITFRCLTQAPLQQQRCARTGFRLRQAQPLREISAARSVWGSVATDPRRLLQPERRPWLADGCLTTACSQPLLASWSVFARFACPPKYPFAGGLR